MASAYIVILTLYNNNIFSSSNSRFVSGYGKNDFMARNKKGEFLMSLGIINLF